MKEVSDRDGGGSRSGRVEKVPFYELFSFADLVLMTIGALAAIRNGVSMGLMTIIFGQEINSFAGSNSASVVHEVTKVCMTLI